ncbi:MAG: hypothetical protein U0797_09265 [Gemmataceae bacterium]
MPWGVLRRLGGEVAEVSAFAAAEAWEEGSRHCWRVGSSGAACSRRRCCRAGRRRFGLGGDGRPRRGGVDLPAGLRRPGGFLDVGGAREAWPSWDPWPAVVTAFEEGALSWRGRCGRWSGRRAAARTSKRRAERWSTRRRAGGRLQGRDGDDRLRGCCGACWCC